MIRHFLLIFILLVAFGCNKVQEVYNDISFENIVAKSDEIKIKLHDYKGKELLVRVNDTFPSVKIYSATKKDQLQNFDKLFERAEKTGYCCCPFANYSITLFKNKELLDTYYVDTLKFKDRVRVYEKGFQYSYVIGKQKWKTYLNSITNKN